jgi:hypothetical protein
MAREPNRGLQSALEQTALQRQGDKRGDKSDKTIEAEIRGCLSRIVRRAAIGHLTATAGGVRSWRPYSLFWWAKSRRYKPLVQMRGHFGLPGSADHFVPRRAWWKQFGFNSQALCFLRKSLFKGSGLFETATQHDTISCIRVLTVGFCSSDPNMPSSDGWFQSGHSN